MSFDPTWFGEPVIIGEQIQERAPLSGDTISECAMAYEARLAATNDPRQAAYAFIGRMRDDLDMTVNVPPKQRERLSRRTKRKLQRALDRLLEQGREAA